jgi:hypothetical protein
VLHPRFIATPQLRTPIALNQLQHHIPVEIIQLFTAPIGGKDPDIQAAKSNIPKSFIHPTSEICGTFVKQELSELRRRQ